MIKSYRDLYVWENSMKLAEKIYAITADFPDKEKYGIVSQLRRAVVSVPSNIAEGYMRNSTKEYIQYLYIALGSLGEIDTQLELSQRIGYYEDKRGDFKEIATIKKQLYSLINKLKQKL